MPLLANTSMTQEPESVFITKHNEEIFGISRLGECINEGEKNSSTLNRTRSYADLSDSARNSLRQRNAMWNWKGLLWSNKREIPEP